MGAENFSANRGGRIYDNAASQAVKTGVASPEKEMEYVGVNGASADYLRNQAAHWAGACAFDRPERRHERAPCQCGNCGAYRLFLAALTKAYAMGRADEIAEGRGLGVVVTSGVLVDRLRALREQTALDVANHIRAWVASEWALREFSEVSVDEGRAIKTHSAAIAQHLLAVLAASAPQPEQEKEPQ